MTAYERKIMDAFEAVSKRNAQAEKEHVCSSCVCSTCPQLGASAAEVTAHMANSGTLSELDTVIDIADQMKAMKLRGYFG